MKSDKFGRQILSESDICELYLQDPDVTLGVLSVDTDITFPESLELNNIPLLKKIEPLNISIEEFDAANQDKWYMPDEYKHFDIAKYVLDLCETDAELQRVGEELLKYQELEMFPMLCYCKYLVDTMRKHNVVWGVGRGSSVSSYVLYLIGIHRINSLHYDLSIDEFLK
jgi:DNA polymerase III alpha subunit